MFHKFKQRSDNKAATAGKDEDPKKVESPTSKGRPTKTSSPSKPEFSKGEAASSRRIVKKKEAPVVEQRKTQVAYRLNHAVKQRPVTPSRSTELVPLTRDYDNMRKQLRGLLAATKGYQQAMAQVTKCRSEVVQQTAKLAGKSPLADSISMTKVVLGESLVSLDAKLGLAGDNAAADYESTVMAYATEWEAIVTKKVDAELVYTNKLHKNLRHYEAKVDKLRKNVNVKEEKGKLTPPLTEKLERNEEKLTQTWKEYEETATTTCHLLDEVTSMGWKDLHPLVKAMMAFEYKRETDEHTLWGNLSNVQDKLSGAVHRHDSPLPASAFIDPDVNTSRPSEEDPPDLGDELELSDDDRS